MRIRTLSAACLMAAALSGCGGNDDAPSPPAPASDQFGAVKSYLLDHTERLKADTAQLRTDAEAYHQLAAATDFDYAALLRDRRDEVRGVLGRLQAGYRKANPSYEEMEGIVAGVPELADYDVIIDAGSDGSDPESAVPFTLKTEAGKTYKQPGNFFFLVETSVFGTEPKFVAKGVRPDLDGDGKVTFGEALPDADFLLAATRDFETNAKELDTAARAWTPAREDVLTALVVMTPTMSEYFGAWKDSRFVAGSKSKESAFVASSRLGDIEDILGGLVVIYDNARPLIAKASPQQADQTGRSLRDLFAFAERLRKEEEAGRRFTAAEAESLGTDAQEQAEAIAGQVSQAAGQLGIDLEA